MITLEWGGIVTWQDYLQSNDFKHLLISIGIFLIVLLIRKIFVTYVYKFIIKMMRKTPSEFLTNLLLAYEKPLQWLFVIIGVYISARVFPYLDESNQLFLALIQSSIVIFITWGLYNLTSSTSVIFSKINQSSDIHLDRILIPFISKGIRFILIAITFSIIAEIFGYPISGFIAGLGLGGLAFALAAQDLLGNLFGGFVIVTDRPFSIGDWILTPSVEGTVEDINFRSTKIRTFAQALVTVPNSTLANEPITNWSKMGKRRISFRLTLTYDSPIHNVRNVVKRINDLLRNHPDIHQETIFVTFDDFKENGAELMLYFFTKTTVWGEYLKVKEDVNFKIIEILEDEGVSIAIPSRRLYSEKDDHPNHNQGDENIIP